MVCVICGKTDGDSDCYCDVIGGSIRICGQCACPFGEPLHFHHDGCPCCAFEDAETQAVAVCGHHITEVEYDYTTEQPIYQYCVHCDLILKTYDRPKDDRPSGFIVISSEVSSGRPLRAALIGLRAEAYSDTRIVEPTPLPLTSTNLLKIEYNNITVTHRGNGGKKKMTDETPVPDEYIQEKSSTEKEECVEDVKINELSDVLPKFRYMMEDTGFFAQDPEEGAYRSDSCHSDPFKEKWVNYGNMRVWSSFLNPHPNAKKGNWLPRVKTTTKKYISVDCDGNITTESRLYQEQDYEEFTEWSLNDKQRAILENPELEELSMKGYAPKFGTDAGREARYERYEKMYAHLGAMNRKGEEAAKRLAASDSFSCEILTRC